MQTYSMGCRPQAASLVQGLRPRNAPLYTMPRWRRGAGAVSMPPVAHPPRVAKPPAATPAGPGPVSALTPSRAVFTISPNAPVGAGLVPAHLWGTVPGSAASFSGQPQNPGRTHLAYTLTSQCSLAILQYTSPKVQKVNKSSPRCRLAWRVNVQEPITPRGRP